MLSNSSLLEQYLEEASGSSRLSYRKDLPLSSVSSFHIGGNASYGVYPESIDELAALCALCRSASVPYYIVGNGSNLLFDDSGYEGFVIFTTSINTIKIEDDTVYAYCGAPVTRLASAVAKEGLSGLEFAYGIPGTVGGALYMNAGAYGGEIKDVVTYVRYYDLDEDEIIKLPADKCGFGYRQSVFQSNENLILSAKLKLRKGNCDEIREKMNCFMQQRKDKQPLEYPSAGSVFKRYPGYYTGKLIEEASLKGFSIGGAQVSEKHAGFIINKGDATASDVLALIEHIKGVIKDNVGIELECEVKYVPNPKNS